METARKTGKEIERDALGRILPGQGALNPNGRPKGKTLKEYARDWFLNMTDEQKMAYLIALEEKRPAFAWSMAEGLPSEDKKITIAVPRPILAGTTQETLPTPENTEEIRDAVAQDVLEDKTKGSEDVAQ